MDGGSARMARIEGIDICGKTGTAQNPHGADHSTFMCFAPRNNPKIAVSVYVENGRWGGIAAAPIASLLTELYLTDTVTRPQLVEYVKNLQINYPYYGKCPESPVVGRARRLVVDPDLCGTGFGGVAEHLCGGIRRSPCEYLRSEPTLRVFRRNFL